MAHAEKWEELTREITYQKYSQRIERRDYRLPTGQVADFYIRIEGPAACALALTTDNKVITLPQYRPGPDAVLREIPGGRADEGESPQEAAVRELLEETGYAGDLEDWLGTWETDAYTQANRSVVIVKNCTQIAQPQLDDTEIGEVELVDMDHFITQVRAGQLTDTAGAFLALDRLGLLA